MQLKKSDFIEIEFVGKVKETNSPFDSNVPEILKEINPSANAKPFLYSLGQDMFLKGIDEFLMKQSPEKLPAEFKIELTPEKSFGKRNPKLIQMIPMKIFRQHNMQPIPGHSMKFDSRVGKILTVSGGRVLVDFNNPLAGKDVIYEIKILRKVDDLNEKAKAFTEFLFRQEMPFTLDKEKKKIIIEGPKGFKQFADMFKDKFKDILDLDLEIKEVDLSKKVEEKKE